MSIRRSLMPLVLAFSVVGLVVWAVGRTVTSPPGDSGSPSADSELENGDDDLIGGPGESDSGRVGAGGMALNADVRAGAAHVESETGTLLLTLVTEPARGEGAQPLSVALVQVDRGTENIECQVDGAAARIELPVGSWHAFCRIQDLGQIEIRAGETTEVRYVLKDCGLQAGTVVDVHDVPVEGVRIHVVVGHVVLSASHGVTDKNGRFQTFMHTSTPLIGIHPDGRMTRSRAIRWTRPGKEEVELVLEAGYGPNRIHVMNEEGVPLAGIAVAVVDGVSSRNRHGRHLQGDNHFTGLTDLLGTVEFEALSARPALIVIDEPGYAVLWQDTPGTGPLDETVVLVPRAKISGRLFREDGMQATGMTVQRRDGAPKDHLRVRSGAGGAFELDGLPRETVRIGVQFINTWVHEQELHLQSGDVTDLEIQLPAVESQEIQVRDEAGNLVDDYTVMATVSGASEVSAYSRERKGRVRLTVVTGWTYDLAVSAGAGAMFEVLSGATLSAGGPPVHEVVVGPSPTTTLRLAYAIRDDAFNEHQPATLYLVPGSGEGKESDFELGMRAATISTKMRRGTYEFLIGMTRETAKSLGHYEVNGDRIDLGTIAPD